MTDERAEDRGPRTELPEFWSAREQEAARDLPVELREQLRVMHIQHRLRLLSWAGLGVQP